MSTTSDGGRTALGGYLYQIVGLLGVKAWAQSVDDSVDSEEIAAFLKLVVDGKVWHERFDQDMVIQPVGITESDEWVLVQFKYSRLLPSPPIGPTEFLEIVDRLVTSGAQAGKLGHNVTGYVLISNRSLGSETSKIVEAAKAGVEHSRIKDNNQRNLLQHLRIMTNWSLSFWEGLLHRFAYKFGVMDLEIERGIDRLIGRLVVRTSQEGSVAIEAEDLKEAFTEARNAHPLTLTDVATRLIQQLDYFHEEQCHEPH